MSSAISATSTSDATLRAGIDRSLRHPVMFFLTSGAAWLAVSILLAIIASIKVHYPEFLDESAYTTYGRVFPAHINTLVYGWGFQAAFGVIIWLMARTSRQQCRSAGTILAAGHVWNLGSCSAPLAFSATRAPACSGWNSPALPGRCCC
jgi:cytochrome c oxidase cbb3-type subunit 1